MANERKLSRKSLHEFFLFLAFFQRNRLPFLFFESLQEIGTFIANFEVFFFFKLRNSLRNREYHARFHHSPYWQSHCKFQK